MRCARQLTLAVPLLVCLLFLISPAAGNVRQSSPKQAADAYWMRITNTLYGAVELSADNGSTWYLVARVIRPTKSPASGGTADLQSVERSSSRGLAFGIGSRRILRLLPDSAEARKDKSAIIVNVPSTFTLFRDFMPSIGSPVLQVVNKRVLPFPTDYAPQDNDMWQINSMATQLAADKVEMYVKDAAERYRDITYGRIRAHGKKPVNGSLTVTARLDSSDNPSAVTFLLDGSVVAILNTAPFVVRWNTKDWIDGEHLVEVRALDARGITMTLTKQLIVVDNRL